MADTRRHEVDVVIEILLGNMGRLCAAGRRLRACRRHATLLSGRTHGFRDSVWQWNRV
jgi:hypothetical protein